MGQAIEQTIRLYPGLLESNQNLLFMLKCRQFIEMVNGSDFDLVSTWRLGSSRKNPKPYHFTTYTNICVFFSSIVRAGYSFVAYEPSANIGDTINKKLSKR